MGRAFRPRQARAATAARAGRGRVVVHRDAAAPYSRPMPGCAAAFLATVAVGSADLPWDQMRDTPGIPRLPEARPTLEVLALRELTGWVPCAGTSPTSPTSSSPVPRAGPRTGLAAAGELPHQRGPRHHPQRGMVAPPVRRARSRRTVVDPQREPPVLGGPTSGATAPGLYGRRWVASFGDDLVDDAVDVGARTPCAERWYPSGATQPHAPVGDN